MIYGEGNTVQVPKLDLLTFLFDSEHCIARDDTVIHAEAEDPANSSLTKSQARLLTTQLAHFLRTQYSIGNADRPEDDIVLTVSSGQSRLPCLFFGVVAELLARTPVCLIYSSGTTTGAAKGVLLSHANMVAEAFLPSHTNRRVWADRKQTLDADDTPPLGPGYRTLAHLPPAHISGVQGYFINPMLDGGIVYWMPIPPAGGGFDMAGFLRYNETLRITTFFTATLIYEALAKLIAYRPGIVGEEIFKSLRVAFSGGARLGLGDGAVSALRSRMGYEKGGRPLLISQTFGATETTGAATHMPPDRAGWDTLGSVGELLPNMRMRLVDDEGRDVPVGMPGEALLKGPVVMIGYHNNVDANAAAFTADGWFRTGDVLKVVDGLVYYVDRKQEIITYKGHKVYPSEFEDILLSHPAVVDAAVVGASRGNDGHGDSAGEVLYGFIVLAPSGAQTMPAVSGKQLIKFVSSKLGSHRKPEWDLRIIEAIPRNSAGKVSRRELKEMALKN